MKAKVEILDSLRAVAALSVCLFHYVCTTTGYFTDETVRHIFSFGKYGVQMFFVISGFVIPWSMFHGGYKFGSFGRFFLKRLSRLEPPYVVSVLLALTVLFLRERMLGRVNDHMEVSATQVFLHFGYLIPFFEEYDWLNQVYWTLAVEFQYYLLMALLFIPLISANMTGRLLMYAALTSSSFFLGSSFLPHWLPLFLLGIVLFMYKAGKTGPSEFAAVTAFLFLFCFYRYPAEMVVCAALPVIMVLGFPAAKLPALHGIGAFSYSIYLIHPLLGGSLINVLSHRFTADYQKPLVIAAGVVVTLVTSWLTFLLVERPSKRLSSSIGYTGKRGVGLAEPVSEAGSVKG